MNTLRGFLGLLALAGLVACGGGGGGAPGFTGAADYQIEGIAATGAAMIGATISVNDSKRTSYSCPEKTGTDGKYSCAVSGKAVPPLLMTAQIGSDDSTSLKSPVLDATPGKKSTVHITPLSNALIQIDWAYLSADGRTSSEITNRIKDRKKQITDALSNVIAEAVDADKANSFDFLTDSSFAANTGTGMDRLLDNISVKNVSSNSSETKFEIALKNTTDKSTLGSADTDLTNTTKKVTTKNTTDIQYFNPATPSRVKADFVGGYTVNVTFYSNNGDGSFDPPETKTVTFTVASDYVITCSTEPLTGCTGSLTYDNNVATFTVTKTSGTNSTTVKGSIDNFFKVTATVSSKDTTSNDSTTGNIVGRKNKSTRTNSLQDFAAAYNISVPSLVYRDAGTGAIVTTSDSTKYPLSVSGTVSIGNDGKVISCSIGGFNKCTGGLVLKHNEANGALFTISANNAANTSNTSSATLWGTFTGTVDTTKKVSGTVNARIKDSYKFSGDFTGSTSQ
jgi:hypothetical protein